MYGGDRRPSVTQAVPVNVCVGTLTKTSATVCGITAACADCTLDSRSDVGVCDRHVPDHPVRADPGDVNRAVDNIARGRSEAHNAMKQYPQKSTETSRPGAGGIYLRGDSDNLRFDLDL